MPNHGKQIVYAPGPCAQHRTLPCPMKCWVKDRTILSWYDGKFTFARTFETTDCAQAYMNAEVSRSAKKASEYIQMGLPVPEQYHKWEYKLWDGVWKP